MRTQKFGIEIEMTGITREKAAKVIAKYFGTESSYIGGSYQAYNAKDRQGRIWKVMSDASITCQRKTESGSKVIAGAIILQKSSVRFLPMKISRIYRK